MNENLEKLKIFLVLSCILLKPSPVDGTYLSFQEHGVPDIEQLMLCLSCGAWHDFWPVRGDKIGNHLIVYIAAKPLQSDKEFGKV